MIFLETFLVNLIKSQRIFAIICYYLKYLVSKFRILVHKRTILAWKLIFCSTLSTFRPKCPKTNGYNQTKNKLSLIIYFGNPKFWKCLGYSYDWLSIPPPDENLLFRTFVQCGRWKSKDFCIPISIFRGECCKRAVKNWAFLEFRVNF